MNIPASRKTPPRRAATLEPTAGVAPYGLIWQGKAEARQAADGPAEGRLVARPDDSLRFKETRHRFYEGENLAVLKLLCPELKEGVKMIYLDPPYNTGRNFVYRDNLSQAVWLSMIYPRLVLAHRLLRPDGMIFISIDDHELAPLSLVLDEIFGEENRVGNLVWSGGRKNDSRLISISHEYLVCYAKSRRHLTRNQIRWHERKPGLERIYAEYARLCRLHAMDHARITLELKRWYARLPAEDPAKANAHYSKSDARGIYFADNISWPGGGGPTYEVLHPLTGRACRVPSRGWVFATPERMQQEIADGRVEFGADENKVPTRKRYLRETEHQALSSVFYQDGRAASQRLRRLFGRKVFDHPKDERVLARLVSAVTAADDQVLDFFAGSAALGHAVLLANEHDGHDRRFLLVQQPEPTPWPEYPTLADVAKERLRLAIRELEAKRESNGAVGETRSLGFQVYQFQPA